MDTAEFVMKIAVVVTVEKVLIHCRLAIGIYPPLVALSFII